MQPTLEMIESQLMLGNVDIAGRLLSLIEAGAQQDDRCWAYKQVIRRLESLDGFAKAGEFERANDELRALEALCPTWSLVAQKRVQLGDLKSQFEAELQKIWLAQSQGNWTEAAIAAQRAQRICPKLPVSRLMREHRDARRPKSIADRSHAHQTQIWGAKSSSRREVRVSDDSGTPKSERFMLWIDGVGGYLGCMSPIVTIGQAIPGSYVDIPIQADISRRHAILRRVGEGYAIDPLHDLKINGRPIGEATYLLDGDEIALTEKVKLRFVKKHSLSATARLDFVSRHRTNPSADGVLLMAESLVLGPQANSHVICREWAGEVVLFRRPEGLACRCSVPFHIDGQAALGKPILPYGAHLGGESFSVTLEKLP
jgi:hypothetical protein